MLRAWRRVALAALSVGAAFAAQFAAVGPAQAAVPTITIAATAKASLVRGYAIVVYLDGKDARARIHGTVTGATAGEVATLYAQPFPYAKAPEPVRSVTLGATGTASYSFTVTPAAATRYRVKLFTRKTATRPLAASATRMVYVATYGYSTGNGLCTLPLGPVCHVTFDVYEVVPSSALRVEMSKKIYPYFGITSGSAGKPPPRLEWLYLGAGHPGIGPVRQISADKFAVTVTFSYVMRNGIPYRWSWVVCSKDSLSKDGLGLPGHHGCGTRRVMQTVTYLG